MLAGTVPVTGPGLVVTVEDPNGSVTYDTLIDIVQELRDAGAEAVAVNDIRIGVATAFAERDRQGHRRRDRAHARPTASPPSASRPRWTAA